MANKMRGPTYNERDALTTYSKEAVDWLKRLRDTNSPAVLQAMLDTAPENGNIMAKWYSLFSRCDWFDHSKTKP